MKRESRGIKEEEKERERGGRQTKGKKEIMGLGPFVYDFVLAMEPFVCISPHLFSKKSLFRGCRYCWPNHVKYCVICCVFFLSNLLLRDSVLNPKNYATQ